MFELPYARVEEIFEFWFLESAFHGENKGVYLSSRFKGLGLKKNGYELFFLLTLA